MRLHFLVTSFLNLYIWDPASKQVVVGRQLPRSNKSIVDKQSHTLVIDKLVAEMHLGDLML